jgi:hypothetical protein
MILRPRFLLAPLLFELWIPEIYPSQRHENDYYGYCTTYSILYHRALLTVIILARLLKTYSPRAPVIVRCSSLCHQKNRDHLPVARPQPIYQHRFLLTDVLVGSLCGHLVESQATLKKWRGLTPCISGSGGSRPVLNHPNFWSRTGQFVRRGPSPGGRPLRTVAPHR